jgi:hypothetical protein
MTTAKKNGIKDLLQRLWSLIRVTDDAAIPAVMAGPKRTNSDRWVIFVVTGTYQQYQRWRDSMSIVPTRDAHLRFMYVSELSQIRGFSDNLKAIIYTGDYHKNPLYIAGHIQELDKQLQYYYDAKECNHANLHV